VLPRRKVRVSGIWLAVAINCVTKDASGRCEYTIMERSAAGVVDTNAVFRVAESGLLMSAEADG
jgi:glycine cleavage system aminomethyltransferase T